MLYPALVSVYFTATENYENFKKDEGYTVKPVFVTYEDEIEYLNVKNRTNAVVNYSEIAKRLQ